MVFHGSHERWAGSGDHGLCGTGDDASGPVREGELVDVGIHRMRSPF